MGSKRTAAVCAFLVMIICYVTSAEEAPEEVMYVTGCLGSDAITLHEATSARDIRAVFVYKGSEILGSDIIPAQGDFKGRLQISRQGQVTLSDLRLTDSGVFRVEMAKRDTKTSTHVVLVLPEPPAAHDNKLHVQTTPLPSNPDHVRLTCGKLTSLGYPPATILWQDPQGRLLSSSSQADGDFHLDLTESSPPGNYTCLLHCTSPQTCCLPGRSKLLLRAHVLVAPLVTTPMTSQVAPDMTSALKKAGEDMATGMAALVNDQVQETFQTNREELDEWKMELEEKMEQKLQKMGTEFERMMERKLQNNGGISVGVKSNSGRDAEDRNFINLNMDQTSLESEIFNTVGTTLLELQQQLDEANRKMTDFQKSVDGKISVLQKKMKTLRRNMKKHGVSKHSPMIQRLTDEMRKHSQDVKEQFSNYEIASQLSKEDLVTRFDRSLSEMETRMYQGKTTVDSFLENITDKMEDVQKKMVSMEQHLQNHEDSHESLRSNSDRSLSSDTVNDTKLRVGMDNTNGVPTGNFGPRFKPTPPRRETSSLSGERISRNISFSAPESCLEVQKKGGTDSGAYLLRPDGLDPQAFWCDMDTAGGGWLVFQRRWDGSVEFYRPWKDYVEGFGDSSSNGEFWLGLDKLHLITSSRPHSLRVDLRTFDGQEGHAFYQNLRVLSSHQKYLMAVYGYSGTAGDSLIVHDSRPFSTWDEDNDEWTDGHCAENYRSAWWYAGCRICDLNAPYTQGTDGIMWLYGSDVWGAGKIAFVEMKIRPQ